MNDSKAGRLKGTMFVPPWFSAPRRFYWQWVHYWSRVRFHKRLVISVIMLGLLGGGAVSLVTCPIYEAKTSVFIGGPNDGAPGCYGYGSAEPAVLKILRKVDDLAEGVGWTNLNLEPRIRKLIDR